MKYNKVPVESCDATSCKQHECCVPKTLSVFILTCHAVGVEKQCIMVNVWWGCFFVKRVGGHEGGG